MKSPDELLETLLNCRASMRNPDSGCQFFGQGRCDGADEPCCRIPVFLEWVLGGRATPFYNWNGDDLAGDLKKVQMEAELAKLGPYTKVPP